MGIKNIKQVFNALEEHNKKQGFCSKPESHIEESANKYIAMFAEDNGLEAHTISPLRWRFDSKADGEIADGVIELEPEKCSFKCVEVKDVKLTHPNVNVNLI